MKKKSTRASDLESDSRQSPDLEERRRRRDERFRKREEETKRLQQPILDELQRRGYEADSIHQLKRKYAPLPKDATDVLLEHVGPEVDRRLLESVIRALGASGEPFDGRPLSDCFDAVSDYNIQWVILNTIACAKPTGIDDWIDAILEHDHFGQELRKLGWK